MSRLPGGLQGLSRSRSRSPPSQSTLWGKPSRVDLGEEIAPHPALWVSPEPPPLLADPRCRWVGTAQGFGAVWRCRSPHPSPLGALEGAG